MAGAATVDKALEVLFHLHDVEGSRGLSEIGRALDLPKSSCHRLLAALAAREIVERDDAGRYRPGLALLSLGIGAQRREPVVAAARPVLEREARRLGETVFLVGRRHGRLRVLDKLEGPGFLRAAPAIGDVVPDGVTAAGQLYRHYTHVTDAPSATAPPSPLAGTAPAEAGGGAWVESGVAATGAATPAAEAAGIAARGYALNRDRWIEGLSVLGVPIWQAGDREGRALSAVLALAAASPRFDEIGEQRIADHLLAAAAEVTQRLGAGSAGDGRRTRPGSRARRAEVAT